MDDILLLLLRRGAHLKPLRITTTELGLQAGMSQQSASRRLLQLERSGLVVRGREGLTLSKKGHSELGRVYSSMKAAFEGQRIELDGVIVGGLGEGGFYVSLEGYRKQIREKLGFSPFPGTLNLRLADGQEWKRKQLLEEDPVMISGFRDRDRTYGDIFAYACKIDGKGCAIIFPLRTHHGPEIIEIVCPFNAKKALRKKDGDRVKVIV